MADIFGRVNPTFSSGFEKTENQGVVIAGGDIHLVQDFSVNYNQQVQPLYEVGSVRVWFSAAPQSGTVDVNTVVGGANASNDALFKPNVCDPQTGTFAFDSCGGGGTFICKGMVCVSVGLSGNSGQAHTAERVQYQFVSLEKGATTTNTVRTTLLPGEAAA